MRFSIKSVYSVAVIALVASAFSLLASGHANAQNTCNITGYTYDASCIGNNAAAGRTVTASSTVVTAANATAAAKVWAAEGGQRVVHTAQHLHGGVGVDRDYPVHRYFLYAKQLELTLGGGTRQLLKLGAMLAAE